MYLSNNEIKKIIDELSITVPDNNYPFVEDDQLQLCSIDLRISNVFWKQKKSRYPIDLHKNKLAELSPRRRWKKVVLNFDNYITLKPGEFILGQTFEKFKIPPEFAGKINTRSSYARLGLETNSATDFLNPGWEGHVPLEIINKSKNSIRIYPLLGMIQIFIVNLSSKPKGNYGDATLFSKYQDDDGGPSLWWRDKLFGQIKKNYGAKLSEETLTRLIEKFSNVDDEGLYRFEKFMEELPMQKISNSGDILLEFQRIEKRKNIIQKIYLYLIPLITTALFGLSLRLCFMEFRNEFILIWVLTVFAISLWIYLTVIREKKQFYTKIST